MTTLGAWALRYAARGWRVFPCRPRDKNPATAHGFKDATTDPECIRQWWTAEPDANIALWPAPSGLVVVDVDSYAAESLARALGLLDEPTLAVETGRSDFAGRHWYFQHPGGHVGQLRLALERAQVVPVSADRPGLEVKADAGYVLLPPSVHPSGREYLWVHEEIRALPPLAVEAFRAAGSPAPGGHAPVPDIISEGTRDTTLAALAGALRRRGASEALIQTALAAINAAHCRPPLPDRDVERIARSVARYDAPPRKPPRPMAGSWGAFR